MLASEQCNDSFYDSQYHSVKMTSDYNFKQEPDMFLDNGSTIATSANATSSTSPPSSNMVAYPTNQQYQQPIQQTLWNKQQCTATASNIDSSYPADALFYASLPPQPPAPPMPALPSLPKKKYLTKRHHPRHHSANGILQQYTHYHHSLQSPHQQQYYLGYPHQRQMSASTITSTSSPVTPGFTMSTSCVASSASTSTTMQYPTTTSTSSSPINASFSPTSPTTLIKRPQNDDAQDKLSAMPSSTRPPLRYEILLQASTAAAQRFGEPSSMTYLNRGQAYGIQFVDQKQHTLSSDVLITSTISITFHDATHRQASQNYWRFWLSQQDRPTEARALDLDAQQSSGLMNVHYPSFDRITFQWQPQAGATMFVRFNCLSTDFSRIKGVKGIPLRALVESTESSSSISSPLGTDNLANASEKSFCKIKLFRDKGAERKNKDDAKQIAKQLDKLKAEGNPQHNPLWHFYNRPVFPYSTFEALPEEDDAIKDEFPMTMTTTPAPPLSIPTVTSNIGAPNVSQTLPPPPPSSISTASSSSLSSLSPTSLIGANPMVSPIQSFSQSNQLHQQYQQPDSNMTIMSPFYSSPFPYPVNYAQVSSPSFMFGSMTSPPMTSTGMVYSQQQQSWSSSATSPVAGMKRTRSHLVASYSDHPSPPEDQPPMKKLQGSLPALTLLVNTKKSQQAMELKRIELDTLSVQQLIIKLSALFSLQAQSVTEVLWRRDSSTAVSNSPLDMQQKKSTNQSSPVNLLVLVEDCVLEQFPDQAVVNVQWEISSAGMVRFILEN